MKPNIRQCRVKDVNARRSPVAPGQTAHGFRFIDSFGNPSLSCSTTLEMSEKTRFGNSFSRSSSHTCSCGLSFVSFFVALLCDLSRHLPGRTSNHTNTQAPSTGNATASINGIV